MEIGLFARSNGESIPSNYTAHTSVLTAVRKDKTHRWARQNLTLQRSGLNAGLDVGTQVVQAQKELREQPLLLDEESQEGYRGCQGAQKALGSRTEALQAPRGRNQTPVPQEERRRDPFRCRSRLRRASLFDHHRERHGCPTIGRTDSSPPRQGLHPSWRTHLHRRRPGGGHH